MGTAEARPTPPDGSDGDADGDAGGNTASGHPTGTADRAASDRIGHLRKRIDEIDGEIIALWQERAAASREVGAARLASGGTRLVLSRERQIMDRYRRSLGPDGTQVALLVLRAGRGPLGGTESPESTENETGSAT